MVLSDEEDRRISAKLGILPLEDNPDPIVDPVNIPIEFNEAVSVFSAKLFKGIYYQETGLPFPTTGCLINNWFTNSQLFVHGNYPLFEALRKLHGKAPHLKRQKTMLNDKFEYKVSLSEDRSLIILQARFGTSFGVIVCGSLRQGYLEAYLEGTDSKSGLKSLFSIIQTPTDLSSAAGA